MAEFIQYLYEGQPDSTPEELFVIPVAQAGIMKHFEAVNIEPAGGLSDTIAVWVLPPAIGTVADQYVWIPETELAPGERLTWGGGDTMGMESDRSMWAQTGLGGGSNGIINVHVSGMLVDELPPGT